MRIAAYRGLIDKIDLGIQFFRLPRDFRECLVDVLHYLLGILLVGLVDGALGTQSKMLEQPAYRCLAQTDSAFPEDHFANDVERPQAEFKLIVERATHRHRVINPLHVLGGQFALAPLAMALLERLPAVAAVA